MQVRIRAACALVAAEINCQADDVMKEIDVVAVYNFASQHAIEPVDVVREVCRRKALINAGVTAIAKDVNQSFIAVYNVCARDWFGIYEAAENSNTPLVKMMRDAYDLNVEKGVVAQPLGKAKAKGAVDLQLERLKLYKKPMDGDTARDKRQATSNTKRAEARDKKVNEKRMQGPPSAGPDGPLDDEDPDMLEFFD